MRLLISFLVIMTLCSCKNVNNRNNNELKSLLHKKEVINADWQDTLDTHNDEMKSSWLRRYRPDLFTESFCGSSYNLPSIGEDVSKYVLITVPNYFIDYDKLLSFASKTSIEDILTLRKDRADGFLTTRNKFIFTTVFKYRGAKWNSVSYGPIFKQFADSISHLNFNKKNHFCVVSIKTSSENNAYETDLVVYEDNELYSLLSNGKSELFRDALIKFKNNLNPRIIR